MVKIIKQDFSPKDFNKIVDEFLFHDAKISIPAESVTSLRGHLVKWGAPLQKTFQAYFERTDNVRYDNLTQEMEILIKKLIIYNDALQGMERKAFVLFWNEIADIITSDYTQLRSQYLKNCCRYFIFELKSGIVL
jgi:hypothetical protein